MVDKIDVPLLFDCICGALMWNKKVQSQDLWDFLMGVSCRAKHDNAAWAIWRFIWLDKLPSRRDLGELCSIQAKEYCFGSWHSLHDKEMSHNSWGSDKISIHSLCMLRAYLSERNQEVFSLNKAKKTYQWLSHMNSPAAFPKKRKGQSI